MAGILTRRHIRIKVLQALYAYFKSNNDNYVAGEKELFFSLNKMYDMYLLYFLVFGEVVRLAENRIEDGKKKRLPSEADLNPNLKFVENKVIKLITENKALNSKSDQRKLNWINEDDAMRKLFKEIRESELYEAYMNSGESSFEEDKVFATKLFKKIIANFEFIHHIFEEKSIYWVDDIDLVCSMVLKSIKQFNDKSDEFDDILTLYKEGDDEEEFAKILFRRTVDQDKSNSKVINERTKNWEVERIASMDVLLMKMALTEAREFNQIPVKVTMNEYIEVSKFYSTPKSNTFINGILDKLFTDMKSSGEISKIGRGLIE